ncbi:MAG: hypothetical protein RBU37_18005 [Myxococcota bacterium]|jgi:hypothetical protein|nr:hypothetical protein [Myxococcota bacterium]
MWQWVRKWLWDDWQTQPKASPVLVAELYGPHALSLYRALRQWQDEWQSYLLEHPHPVEAQLSLLARSFRRLLLHLQRLRHCASAEAERQKYTQHWQAWHLKPSDRLSVAMGELFEMLPEESSEQALEQACSRILPMIEHRNRQLSAVFEEAH